jgi:hypothetical protein
MAMATPRRVAAGLVLWTLTGCGDGQLVEPPPGGPGAETPTLPSVRWQLRGKARFVTDPLIGSQPVLPDSAEPARPAAPIEQTTDVVALAQQLRPIMLFDGYEYEASWEDSLELARQVLLSRQRARAERPRGRAPAKVELSRREAIIGGNDGRENVSAESDASPRRYTAVLEIPRSWNPDAQKVEEGYCTCNKMINHATCVTAAHCVHIGAGDARIPADKVNTWRPMPKIQFKAASSTPAPQIDPSVPAQRYAIVVPRAWWNGDRNSDFAVIRFRGSVPASVYDGGQLPLNANPAVPGEHFDYGPDAYLRTRRIEFEEGGPAAQTTVGFFALGGFPSPEGLPESCQSKYPCFVEGYTVNVTLLNNFRSALLYNIDAMGGQSGTALLMRDDDNVNYRVVAIHKGERTSGTGTVEENRGVRISDAVEMWLSAAAGGSGTVFSQ